MNFAGAKPTTTKPARLDAADLTIVGGGGHVGIPLVLAFAEAGYRVNVHDTNRDVLETLRAGRLPFIEYGGEALLAKALERDRLVFTSAPADIPAADPSSSPSGPRSTSFSTPFARWSRTASTVCCRISLTDNSWCCARPFFPARPIGSTATSSASNRELKLAFCPERMVQGHGIKELKETPQIISATTPAAEKEAAKLFSAIAPELVVVTPREAELAKLFNNAYRYIEFATANQFYLIAKAAGVDYRRVSDAMKRNYPRARGIPSPGLAAGPCLMKDTAQLAAFAQNQFSLGNAAMLVNEGLVLHLCDDLRRRYDLSRMTVGLLGMAFKAEIDDTRASLSYKFKKALASLAEDVLTTDPFVTTDPELQPLDDVIARSDLLVLCAPHAAYRDLDFGGKPVVDVWGFLKNANVIS